MPRVVKLRLDGRQRFPDSCIESSDLRLEFLKDGACFIFQFFQLIAYL